MDQWANHLKIKIRLVYFYKGSVFLIDLELSIVKPIAYNCLSYPSGLAISKNEKILYVSETAKNRIIRFVLSPQGIYYYSNFV